MKEQQEIMLIENVVAHRVLDNTLKKVVNAEVKVFYAEPTSIPFKAFHVPEFFKASQPNNRLTRRLKEKELRLSAKRRK